MTTFKSAAPVFAVADVAATARCYQQDLGFEFHHFPECEPWEWAGMRHHLVEIVLQRVVKIKILTLISSVQEEHGTHIFVSEMYAHFVTVCDRQMSSDASLALCLTESWNLRYAIRTDTFWLLAEHIE